MTKEQKNLTNQKFGPGFHRMYAPNRLTLGIGFPIEPYSGPIATMERQVELAQKAEQGGFAALWCRDVPLLDPSFGDAGQMYDPWIWFSFIAAHTTNIALGTGSIILPLRNPLDLAKSATSVDQLSKGRLVLGVATGDRPVEYSAYNTSFEERGEVFKETLALMRQVTHRPDGWENHHAASAGRVDLLPKSYAGDLPFLVTGHSRQSLEWIAEHADGWLMYPRAIHIQKMVLEEWQRVYTEAGHDWKAFSQSLYIDLTEDPDELPKSIHLGYRLGRNSLIEFLKKLESIGVNHVAFNIKFSSKPADEVLDELATYVVPEFEYHKDL